jgi:hypothetical protein
MHKELLDMHAPVYRGACSSMICMLLYIDMHALYIDMHALYIDMHALYIDMHALYIDMHALYIDMHAPVYRTAPEILLVPHRITSSCSKCGSPIFASMGKRLVVRTLSPCRRLRLMLYALCVWSLELRVTSFGFVLRSSL